jgi:hypothetical protein
MRSLILAPWLGLSLAVAGPLAESSAKVANLEFSGQGFASSSGLFADAPALSWNGSITLDLDATDDDPADGVGSYTSAVSNFEFSLPLLGVNFSSTAPEQVTEVVVDGNTRTLNLAAVNLDEGIELASSFTLTDLGSIFTPIDDTLPQTELDFGAFDELSFSLAFADAGGATPAPLGGFLVTPDTASLELVETPLPAGIALLGTALVTLRVLNGRRRRSA